MVLLQVSSGNLGEQAEGLTVVAPLEFDEVSHYGNLPTMKFRLVEIKILCQAGGLWELESMKLVKSVWIVLGN